MSNIYPKITDQLQNGGEVIQNSVDQAEKNISKNISDAQKKIENYFSGIKDAVLGKETQQENTGNCPCPNP
jgi:hypothetical protein